MGLAGIGRPEHGGDAGAAGAGVAVGRRGGREKEMGIDDLACRPNGVVARSIARPTTRKSALADLRKRAAPISDKARRSGRWRSGRRIGPSSQYGSDPGDRSCRLRPATFLPRLAVLCVPQCDGERACRDCGKGLCLSCGTSLERIAPESLTRCLSDFVHGHIWRHRARVPQDRVERGPHWPSIALDPLTRSRIASGPIARSNVASPGLVAASAR